MTTFLDAPWLTHDEYREFVGAPPLAVIAVGTGGVKMDSLGRRWDPRKHPRGRDGRFIEVGGLIKFFDSLSSRTVAGSGTVTRIDGDSIYVNVTASNRNPGEVGGTQVFNRRQIATIPPGEVRLDRRGNVNPEDRELPDKNGKLVRVGDTVRVGDKVGKVTRVDDNSGRVVVRNNEGLHVMRRVEKVERLDDDAPAAADPDAPEARLDTPTPTPSPAPVPAPAPAPAPAQAERVDARDLQQKAYDFAGGFREDVADMDVGRYEPDELLPGGSLNDKLERGLREESGPYVTVKIPSGSEVSVPRDVAEGIRDGRITNFNAPTARPAARLDPTPDAPRGGPQVDTPEGDFPDDAPSGNRPDKDQFNRDVPEGWVLNNEEGVYEKDGYTVQPFEDNNGAPRYAIKAGNRRVGEAVSWSPDGRDNGPMVRDVEGLVENDKAYREDVARLNREQMQPFRGQLATALERQGFSPETLDAVRYGSPGEAKIAVANDPAYAALRAKAADAWNADNPRGAERDAINDFEKARNAAEIGIRGPAEERSAAPEATPEPEPEPEPTPTPALAPPRAPEGMVSIGDAEGADFEDALDTLADNLGDSGFDDLAANVERVRDRLLDDDDLDRAADKLEGIAGELDFDENDLSDAIGKLVDDLRAGRRPGEAPAARLDTPDAAPEAAPESRSTDGPVSVEEDDGDEKLWAPEQLDQYGRLNDEALNEQWDFAGNAEDFDSEALEEFRRARNLNELSDEELAEAVQAINNGERRRFDLPVNALRNAGQHWAAGVNPEADDPYIETAEDGAMFMGRRFFNRIHELENDPVQLPDDPTIAGALLRALDNASQVDYPLERIHNPGAIGTADNLRTFTDLPEVGQELDLRTVSFTNKDPLGDMAPGFQGFVNNPDSAVRFRVAPGARALSIAEATGAPQYGEHLAKGKFRIASIEPGDRDAAVRAFNRVREFQNDPDEMNAPGAEARWQQLSKDLIAALPIVNLEQVNTDASNAPDVDDENRGLVSPESPESGNDLPDWADFNGLPTIPSSQVADGKYALIDNNDGTYTVATPSQVLPAPFDPYRQGNVTRSARVRVDSPEEGREFAQAWENYLRDVPVDDPNAGAWDGLPGYRPVPPVTYPSGEEARFGDQISWRDGQGGYTGPIERGRVVGFSKDDALGLKYAHVTRIDGTRSMVVIGNRNLAQPDIQIERRGAKGGDLELNREFESADPALRRDPPPMPPLANGAQNPYAPDADPISPEIAARIRAGNIRDAQPGDPVLISPRNGGGAPQRGVVASREFGDMRYYGVAEDGSVDTRSSYFIHNRNVRSQAKYDESLLPAEEPASPEAPQAPEAANFPGFDNNRAINLELQLPGNPPRNGDPAGVAKNKVRTALNNVTSGRAQGQGAEARNLQDALRFADESDAIDGGDLGNRVRSVLGLPEREVAPEAPAREPVRPRPLNLPPGVRENIPENAGVVPDDERFIGADVSGMLGEVTALAPRPRRGVQLNGYDRYTRNLGLALRDIIQARSPEQREQIAARIELYFDRAIAGRPEGSEVGRRLQAVRDQWTAMRAGRRDESPAPESPDTPTPEPDSGGGQNLVVPPPVSTPEIIADSPPGGLPDGPQTRAMRTAADDIREMLAPIQDDVRNLDDGDADILDGVDRGIQEIANDLDEGSINLPTAIRRLEDIEIDVQAVAMRVNDRADIPGDIGNDIVSMANRIGEMVQGLVSNRDARAQNTPVRAEMPEWERELLRPAAPAAPQVPADFMPAMRVPRMQPGVRGRGQYADAVLRNLRGDELRIGVLVRLPDGTEGWVSRMHPPSGRVVIRNEQGLNVQRDADHVRALYDDDVPAPAAPAATPAAPPAPAARPFVQITPGMNPDEVDRAAAGLPPAPDANADGEARARAIVEMHQAGAARGFQLEPEVRDARANIEEAQAAARRNDQPAMVTAVGQAIANYERALARGIRNPDLAADVRLRRDAAAALLDDLNAGRAFAGNPNFDAVLQADAQQLRDLRAAIPTRRQYIAGAMDGRTFMRNAGFALSDALDPLRDPEERKRALTRARRNLSDAIRQGQPDAQGILDRLNAIAPPPPEPFVAVPRVAPAGPSVPAAPAQPGFLRARDVRPTHAEALNPDAVPEDYNDKWGYVRGEDIARAARERPSFEAIGAAGRGDQLALAKAAFDGEYGNSGLVFKVNSVYGQGRNIHINGTIHKDGRNVGLFERSITDKKVYNAHFKIRANIQGGGAATEFNNHMENWYIANGVDKVTVSAAAGGDYIGSFVWARNGFDWSGGKYSAQGFVDDLERNRTVRSSPELQAKLTDLRRRVDTLDVGDVNFPTPFEISSFGQQPGQGRDAMWPGKQVMLVTAWSGVKELNPSSKAYREQVRAGRWPNPADTVRPAPPAPAGPRQYGPADIPDALRNMTHTTLDSVGPPGSRGMIQGFDVQRLRARDPDLNVIAGINDTFIVTDPSTGRQFIFKRDSESQNARAEVDAALAIQATGMPGAAYVEISPTDDLMIISTFVGEQDGMTNYRKLKVVTTNMDDAGAAAFVGNMADPSQLIRARLMNAILANFDRHGNNAYIANGTDGKDNLLLFDHGLALNDMALRMNVDTIMNLQQSSYGKLLRAHLKALGDADSEGEITRIAQLMRSQINGAAGMQAASKNIMLERLDKIITDPSKALGIFKTNMQ